MVEAALNTPGPEVVEAAEERCNIASVLVDAARTNPHRRAIVYPSGRDATGRRAYTHLTFAQLQRETYRLARGLRAHGIGPGTRTVLMVRPSLEFIPLTFALFTVGAVPVLIDPGMGRKGFLRAIEEIEPEGFIGIPLAHVLRTVFPRPFRSVKKAVTVGRRLWWSAPTLDELRDDDGSELPLAPTAAGDLAAILFTTGSTGPAKGVEYTHGIFTAQVDIIRDVWGIGPQDVDLPAFPLFALFSTGCGATVVIPDMDPTRPAEVDPALVVEAIEDQGVTFSFGSPAFWRQVAAHCDTNQVKLPTLSKVFMAGAPVPAGLVASMRKAMPESGDVLIPYGATESLPVAWISGAEVEAGAGDASTRGRGTCVGRPLECNEVRIIEVRDEPIPHLEDATPVSDGEVGEICVRGPVVTARYARRDADTALAKMRDGDVIWHRMGDLGYFDDQGRLWFCGRKGHRVETPRGVMYTVQCEALFNNHPRVYRTALVGLGERPSQRPVLVVECEKTARPKGREDREGLIAELKAIGASSPLTEDIHTFLFHDAFPVDIRHNAKIFRERLAAWAATQSEVG